MKKLVVLVAVLACAREAYASSCGGGGGSSGSSGGGGGYSSSDSSSTTATCTDSTDIVGYRQCQKYGTWANTMKIPLLIFELGVAVQTFDSPLEEGSGSVAHEGEDFTYRVVSDSGNAGASERAVAVVTSLRVGVGSRIGIYGAGELELGGLAAEPTRMEMTSTGKYGAPKIEQTSALAMGALAVAGYQRGTTRMLFGAELAGGVRAVSYNYHSQYLACEQSVSIVVARPVLEARARASMFVTPNLSVGAQLGSSLIDQHDWNAGVFFGGYTRAFAAAR